MSEKQGSMFKEHLIVDFHLESMRTQLKTYFLDETNLLKERIDQVVSRESFLEKLDQAIENAALEEFKKQIEIYFEGAIGRSVIAQLAREKLWK